MFIYREQPGRVHVYNYTDYIYFYLFYQEQPGRAIYIQFLIILPGEDIFYVSGSQLPGFTI